MADPADLGNDTADFFLGLSLKKVKTPTVEAGIGLCLNCGEAVPGDARWCDAHCRDDWEKQCQR